jgi:capsular polysaccharide biosynthesis protein
MTLTKVKEFIKKHWKLLLLIAAMIIAVAVYYFIKIKRKQ